MGLSEGRRVADPEHPWRTTIITSAPRTVSVGRMMTGRIGAKPRRPLDDPLAKTISAAAWESFGALGHGDDYVAALVPLLDVRVGLDDLLQRVAPVDDRPDLPGLDEFFEEDKVLGTPASRT